MFCKNCVIDIKSIKSGLYLMFASIYNSHDLIKTLFGLRVVLIKMVYIAVSIKFICFHCCQRWLNIISNFVHQISRSKLWKLKLYDKHNIFHEPKSMSDSIFCNFTAYFNFSKHYLKNGQTIILAVLQYPILT